MTPLAIGMGAAFGSIALLLLAFHDYLAQRRRVYTSLRQLRVTEIHATDLRRRELATPWASRLMMPAVRRMSSVARRMTPAGIVERLNEQLLYAGSPAAWDAERVLAAKLMAGVVLGLASLAFSLTVYGPSPRMLIITVVGAMLGWYLPEWLVRSRADARQAQIRTVLPDSLDLLSITVQAGLAFDAALVRVAREMGGALGEEMNRVVQEMQRGKSRSEALRGLSERSSVEELREFVLAMIQAEVFGVSIANVLHVQAGELRIKRRQRAEERAQMLPVKMIFPLILFILPATFIVLIGPAVVQIMNTF
jgi:tight adherence protein C